MSGQLYESFYKAIILEKSVWVNLSKQMFEIAQNHAISCLCIISQNNDNFYSKVNAAQHAGACAEMITKSILSAFNPYSLFDAQNLDKVLLFEENKAEESIAETYSINASRSCQLVFHDANKDYSSMYSRTMRILLWRNKAVHMGFVPKNMQEFSDTFALWLRDFVAKYGLSLDDYLSSSPIALKEIRSLLQNSSALVRERVNKSIIEWDEIKGSEKLIKKAQNSMKQKTKKRQEEAEKINSQKCEDCLLVRRVKCPTCGHEGLFVSRLVGYSTEADDDRFYYYPYYEEEFSCDVCKLSLRNNELYTYNSLYDYAFPVR